MTKNYQITLKLYEALNKALEEGDAGSALTTLTGIPITYDPDATREFTINGTPYFYDDDVYLVFLELMGLDSDDEKEVLKEAFDYRDDTATKVGAFILRRRVQ